MLHTHRRIGTSPLTRYVTPWPTSRERERLIYVMSNHPYAPTRSCSVSPPPYILPVSWPSRPAISMALISRKEPNLFTPKTLPRGRGPPFDLCSRVVGTSNLKHTREKLAPTVFQHPTAQFSLHYHLVSFFPLSFLLRERNGRLGEPIRVTAFDPFQLASYTRNRRDHSRDHALNSETLPWL